MYKINFIIYTLLTISKFIIYFISNSIFIFASATDNLSDLIIMLFSLIAIKIATKSPDKKHPYGYLRAQNIGGLIIATTMISYLGINLVQESIIRIINPVELQESILFPIIVLIVSIIVSAVLFIINFIMARKQETTALNEAKADLRNDVTAQSLGIISIIISSMGFFLVESILSLIVAILIIYSGISLVRENVSILMGNVDEDIKEKVEQYFNNLVTNKEINDYKNLKLITFGPEIIQLNANIILDEDISLKKAYNIIEKIKFRLPVIHKYIYYITIEPFPQNVD